MFFYLNEIAAFVGIAFLVLSFRGFWPHMWNILKAGRWSEPHSWLVLSILLVDVKGVARMFYWDILQSVVNGPVTSVHGTITNTAINLMAGLAGLIGCAALYYSIPEEERHGWNWFTAPFYPNKRACFARLFRR